MHQLVVPEAAAGPRVEGDERIGEQVVALSIAAVEVEPRAAGVDERDAALLVHRRLAPVVPATRPLVGLRWPRFVTDFTGQRNGVEHPQDLAGHDVVSLDLGGVRVVLGSLRRQRHDHDVLEDAPGIAGLQRVEPRPVERDAQVDASLDAEAGNRVARVGADRRQVPAGDEEEPAILAICAFPIVHPASADGALLLL
jgi:hypothetical protein